MVALLLAEEGFHVLLCGAEFTQLDLRFLVAVSYTHLDVYKRQVGAVNAVSCANMALAGVDYAIPCDEVIDAMGRVGSLLSPDLRETGPVSYTHLDVYKRQALRRP